MPRLNRAGRAPPLSFLPEVDSDAELARHLGRAERDALLSWAAWRLRMEYRWPFTDGRILHWLHPSFQLAEWAGVYDVLCQTAARVLPEHSDALPSSLAQTRMAEARASGGAVSLASASTVLRPAGIPDTAGCVDVAHALVARATTVALEEVGGSDTMASSGVGARTAGGAQSNPRGLCLGTDSPVGDGCVAVAADGEGAGAAMVDVTAGAVRLPRERLSLPRSRDLPLSPTPTYPLAPDDSAAAAIAAVAQARAEDGLIRRTVHGDVLCVRCSEDACDDGLDSLEVRRPPHLHTDIALCGFAPRVPMHMVRADDDVPAAYPHLPPTYCVHGAPEYLTTLAGGFFLEESSEEEGEEEGEEGEYGDEEGVGGQERREVRTGTGSYGRPYVGWTAHERRLLAAAGPEPEDDGSLAACVAVTAHSARFAALLRDDPPFGVSGADLWAHALQAAQAAEDAVAAVAEQASGAGGGAGADALVGPGLGCAELEALVDALEDAEYDRCAHAVELDVLRGEGLPSEAMRDALRMAAQALSGGMREMDGADWADEALVDAMGGLDD